MSNNSSLIKINNEVALHSFLLATSENGVHGIRIYNQKFQYKYNDTWRDVLSSDIPISPNANNALKKLSNGYFVQSFLISNDSSNAIVKRYDGYYVKKEIDVAHLSDLNSLRSSINTQINNINNNITLISDKLLELGNEITKIREYVYEDITTVLTLVADASLLINPSDYVILNIRILVQNKSNNSVAELKFTEYDINTMTISLEALEVQQYDLGNAASVKIYTNGNVKLYVRITYV